MSLWHRKIKLGVQHNEQNKKLSKRDDVLSVDDYKSKGYLAKSLVNYMLRMGWSYGNNEIITVNEAIKNFTLNKVGKSPSMIDEKKALWFSNDLTTDDIENMCNSTHRDYKSGTKILIRASIDTHRGNNDLKCKIYDENEKIVHDVITLAKNKDIKKIILEDLVDGVASDLKKRIHIRSVKDLLVYSYRVAGTVGLMMSKILMVNDRRAFKGAIDLGIAMQLTNIARDVVEDKKMNREYIKPDFENIQATLKLAEMFYESSFSSIQKIPLKYKFSIIVARRIYRQIGRKILQKGNM